MSNTTLSREEITTRVIAMIKEVVDQPNAEVTAKTSLLNELDIDSLTMVRLDIMIQSNIGLALSADDLEGVNTVDDLVTALVTRGQPVEIEE
ncbi:MAG TPA: phosphopantetheine-binding protein [Kofleriaceae bacterium]|jgi:acyl carrier protein|nr:phosphopantetheine-binding protein [Kofleriaceae bacterium]